MTRPSGVATDSPRPFAPDVPPGLPSDVPPGLPPDVPPGLPPLLRRSWLGVDLDALAGNLAAFRRALPPGVRIEAVVKADAYGHGAVPVAFTLANAGVDGFCVATLDEAIELREAGLREPIIVLFPVPPEAALEAAARDVAVVAGDLALLERTLAVLEGAAAIDDHLRERPLAIHVEVETGLGRCGIAPEQVGPAAALIQATPGVHLAGLWSHLAAAGDVPRTAAQNDRLGAATRLLDDAAVRVPRRHLAASGAILAGSAPSYDAVRIGLSLYGLLPDGLAVARSSEPLASELRPILSLRALPIRVADLPEGSGVSYGPSFVTARPSRIATLPVGYADGFARILSNRATALVRGHRVPVVGTVAMDAIMLDVTDVPGPSVTVDDEFVLIGTQGDARIAVEELARERSTITYEVVTSMSRRMTRVYYAAAGPVGVRTLTEERGTWRASSSGTATSATSRSTSS